MDLAGAASVADLVDERSHRRRPDDAVLDQEDPFAGQDFGQRRVFEPGLGGAVGGALDERPADVAVAHQPLDRGDLSAKAMASAAALAVSGTGTTIVSASSGTSSSRASSLPRAARLR